MSTRMRDWKYAAVIALVGTGIVAAAVGVKHKYPKKEDGHYVVVHENGRTAWSFSEKTAGSPQQAVETAEEMDLLIEQGKRELVSVDETEVNGRLDNRKLGHQYALSDGRIVRQFENDPDTGPGTLPQEQQEEADRLWREVLANSKFIGTPGTQPLMLTADGEIGHAAHPRTDREKKLSSTGKILVPWTGFARDNSEQRYRSHENHGIRE